MNTMAGRLAWIREELEVRGMGTPEIGVRVEVKWKTETRVQRTVRRKILVASIGLF